MKIQYNNNNNEENNNGQEPSRDSNNEDNINYISEEFYKNFITESNILINEVDRIGVLPDGNCYMHYLALSIYNNESEHLR